jgi:hypothetical protein
MTTDPAVAAAYRRLLDAIAKDPAGNRPPDGPVRPAPQGEVDLPPAPGHLPA